MEKFTKHGEGCRDIRCENGEKISLTELAHRQEQPDFAYRVLQSKIKTLADGESFSVETLLGNKTPRSKKASPKTPKSWIDPAENIMPKKSNSEKGTPITLNVIDDPKLGKVIEIAEGKYVSAMTRCPLSIEYTDEFDKNGNQKVIYTYFGIGPNGSNHVVEQYRDTK